MSDQPRPEAIEAIREPEWGRWLAWVVNGAPTRDEGVAAAKWIVDWRLEVDTLRQRLSEVEHLNIRLKHDAENAQDWSIEYRKQLEAAEAKLTEAEIERDRRLMPEMVRGMVEKLREEINASLNRASNGTVTPDELRDEARDLRMDASSWREASNSTSGHAATVLMRDALANEARAQSLEEKADKLATLLRETGHPELACRVPAPDRSGRLCDKPQGHTGKHWTHGGHTLEWK